MVSTAVLNLAARLRDESPFPLRGLENTLVTEAHQELLRHALADPPRVTVGTGRGIVQAVGGCLYFACAYAGVSVLRALGCTLPVEWWYLGPAEMDPRMIELARALGVTCVDALEVAARVGRPRILNGWELKAFAAAHCGFAEVLFLDADNVAVNDPTVLFDRAEYLDKGAVFWPDLPPYDRKEWMPAVVWENVGLEYRDEPDFESGQFLVDKRRCRRELGVTVHINSHSDWYYRFVFGDKSTFHLAWRVCGADYAIPSTPAGWVYPAIQQSDFDGHVLFQHVCQGKAQLANGHGLPGLVRMGTAGAAVTDLRARWNGEIWSRADQTPAETELAKTIAGRWKYRRLIDPDGRSMVLLPDGSIGEGAAGCERRWTARVVDGTPTLVIVGAAHKGTQIGMMFLRADEAGAWRGRWEAHERCEVELVRHDGADVGWATVPQADLERASRDGIKTRVVDADTVRCTVFARYQIYCPRGDVTFTPHMITNGYWESWNTVALGRMLRPGMFCVDVGANCGYFSVLFAAGVGRTGRVLAVEPQARLAGLITRTAAENKFTWLDMAHAAATDGRTEVVDLIIPDGEHCNATCVLPFDGTRERVPARSLDSLLADWPRVDLIKIDAEGAEELIWRGMHETVARHRPMVVLEFNADRYADPKAFLGDLISGRNLRSIRTNSDVAPVSVEEVLTPGSEHMLVIS